ncbi:MAG: hypothetical protein KDD12_09615 [Lewinella sp.]|nr:hypothetical protein [Lewinella sp.]
MKKCLLLAAFALSTAIANDLSAQYYKPTRIFKQGQADIRASAGLLPTYAKDASRMVVPPVSLGVDWMVSDQFSVGVELGYSHYQMEKLPAGETDMRHYDNQTLLVMTRALAHFTRRDNLDIYGGFRFGTQMVRIRSLDGPFGAIEQLIGIRPQRTRFQYGACLGFRFAVSPGTHILGEAGTGISLINVGVGFKIK